MNMTNTGVLIIYTGGTIGSMPSNLEDLNSPLIPCKDLKKLFSFIDAYDDEKSTMTIDNYSIPIDTYCWETPLDSSNIMHEHWVKICRIILENYSKYEGFVIMHGTDTMAYSASALSFMLENLQKPVIFTGSQRPLINYRSDAIQNILTSILYASPISSKLQIIPEVCIFFGGGLYRGNRSTKISTTAYGAYATPNFAMLGRAGNTLWINKDVLLKQPMHFLRTHDNIESDVASIDIFPGMSVNLVDNILKTEGLKACIIKTFGSGNAPSTSEFLEVIRAAVLRGIIIMDITQCWSGEVSLGRYETSSGLLSCGVISGFDMTMESALAKLFIVIGLGHSIEESCDILQIDLRGEQTQSAFNLRYGQGEMLEDSINTISLVRSMTYKQRFHPIDLNYAQLRLTGVHFLNSDDTEIEFYLDLPDKIEPNKNHGVHYLGTLNHHQEMKKSYETLILNISESAKMLIDNRHPHSITCVIKKGSSFKYDDMRIVLYTNGLR